MSDGRETLFLLVFGAGLALHCALATRRELKAGLAKGVLADHDRETRPVQFWLVIAANALAAILGAILLIAGLVQLAG